MNISALSSTQTVQSSSTSSTGQRNQLSDEQKDLVSSVLEGYDSGSLSQEDAVEIASTFQAAGISPSRDLANTIADSGFSAQEIGELAGVTGGPAGAGGLGVAGGPPPPPPPQNTDEEEYSISTLLETLLNSDEEEETNSASLYGQISDYTSRIISLNEEAKDKVKELFESYSSENTQLSPQDASKVVVNSLSQILGDSNNYKNTSFYG